jgi:hypothetical protein
MRINEIGFAVRNQVDGLLPCEVVAGKTSAKAGSWAVPYPAKERHWLRVNEAVRDGADENAK